MSEEPRPEKELIELCLNGDEDAFRTLIEENKPKLKSSMLGAFNGLTETDFDDCWQNAIIKAYNNLESFRKDSSFKTWIYVILRNEIILFLKYKQNQEKHEVKLDQIIEGMESDNLGSYDLIQKLDNQLAETASTILEKQEAALEYQSLIEKALSSLDTNHAEILTRVLIENKSYKEVATELNIPIGTVMSRLFFARKNMQKAIKYHAIISNIQLPHIG